MAVGSSGNSRFAKGGMVGSTVQYLAQGGDVGGGATGVLNLSDASRQALENFTSSGNRLAEVMRGFESSVSGLASAFRTFDASASRLSESIATMPHKITTEATVLPVEVVVSGADAFAALEGGLKETLQGIVDSAIQRAFRDRLPDA